MSEENGREYKVCPMCNEKFYRDAPPNDKLNDANWGRKVFCTKKCKNMKSLKKMDPNIGVTPVTS
jgi:hypothetical protein